MTQQNELINLIIEVGVLSFLLMHLKEVSGPYHFKLLVVAYLLSFGSGLCTVLEDTFWYDFFNPFEHICDFLRAVVLLIWIVKLVNQKETQ